MALIDSSTSFRASSPVFFYEDAQRTARIYKNPTMCRVLASLRKPLPTPGATQARTRATRERGLAQGALPFLQPQVRAAAVDAFARVHQIARTASKSVTPSLTLGQASPAPSTGAVDTATCPPKARTKTVVRKRVHVPTEPARPQRSGEPSQRPRDGTQRAASTAAVAWHMPPLDGAGAGGSAVEGEVVPPGDKPPLCRSPSPSVQVALPVDAPADAPDPTVASVQAVAAAGQRMEQARAAGVDLGSWPVLRRLLQVAHVPVAFIDLVAAGGLALVSAGTCRSAAVMAAYQLKEAVLALGKPVPRSVASGEAAAPIAAGEARQVEAGTSTGALEAIRRARDSLQQARREANVDMARAAFLNRLLGVGAATVGFGLAIAATVATGGLAGLALLVSALLLRQAIANAHCAWLNKQAVEQGRPPLPLGTSALGNAMYAHHQRQGRTPEQAKWEAAKVSAICGTLVAGAGLSVGAAINTVLPLAAKCIRAICSFVAAVALPSVDHLRSGAIKANLKEHQRLLEREVVQPCLERCITASQASVQAEARALVAELQAWELRAPSVVKLAEELAAARGQAPVRKDAAGQALRSDAETAGALNWAVPTTISAASLLFNGLV